MKITNDDLRLIAVSKSPYGQVDGADVADELLQRRAKVRRLRRALWEVRHRADYGHSVRLVIEAALAPKRKRRAK